MSDDVVPTAQRWPTVPEPTTDPKSLYNSLQRVKETVELLTGQRGILDPTYSVDYLRETLTRTVNDLSATVSESKEIAVSNDAALAEQINTVEAEVVAARSGEPSLNARIVQVNTASVTRDTALTTSLNAVSARVDDVSAGGFFKTTATVTGGNTLASMEAQVYTTTAHTGTLTAGWRTLISGGTSWFDMYSANWRLIDTSGTPKQVMFYTGGLFQFTGNVGINGNLVFTGTINTIQLTDLAVQYPKIYPNAVTTAGSAEGTSEPITVSVNARVGASLLIVGSIDGSYGNSPGGGSAQLAFYVNGGLFRAPYLGAMSYQTGIGTNPGGEVYPIMANSYFPLTKPYVYIAGYTGTHTIQLYGLGPVAGISKVLVVTELAR